MAGGAGKNEKPNTKPTATRAAGQQTLEDTMQGKLNNKKVAFADGDKDKDKEKEARKERLAERNREAEYKQFKENVTDEVRKIRAEKLELEKVKVEINAAMRELGERLSKSETKMQEYEAREKEWLEMQTDQSIKAGGSLASAPTEGTRGSLWSLRSGVSARSMALSDREVDKMRKMVYEQERKERRNNIVIRGIKPTGDNLKVWVRGFFKEKLDIDTEIEAAWVSGTVVIVKIDSTIKDIIMKSKNKLSGTTIFIEHDLCLEDRKKQEEIYKWVRERKAMGWNVRSGGGSVWFKGRWIKWENKNVIEKEMERDLNRADMYLGDRTGGREKEGSEEGFA